MKTHGYFKFENLGVYHDTSSKGGGKRHDLWRAVAVINGKRVRRRFADREEAKAWLREGTY